jgi:hypothetical protein
VDGRSRPDPAGPDPRRRPQRESLLKGHQCRGRRQSRPYARTDRRGARHPRCRRPLGAGAHRAGLRGPGERDARRRPRRLLRATPAAILRARDRRVDGAHRPRELQRQVESATPCRRQQLLRDPAAGIEDVGQPMPRAMARHAASRNRRSPPSWEVRPRVERPGRMTSPASWVNRRRRRRYRNSA